MLEFPSIIQDSERQVNIVVSFSPFIFRNGRRTQDQVRELIVSPLNRANFSDYLHAQLSEARLVSGWRLVRSTRKLENQYCHHGRSYFRNFCIGI
jgi:hypothetical protein